MKKNNLQKLFTGLLTVCITAFTTAYTACTYIPDSLLGDSSSSSNQSEASSDSAFSSEDSTTEDIVTAELSIHFLQTGNAYTGDSTLIKVGNTEVLIDAGSRKNSAPTLKSYIDTYCTDGVLEYVIATHAHQDHIAGFLGNKSGSTRNGIFYTYEIETLIQFARSDQPLKTEAGNDTLYAEYLAAVETLKTSGTTVYTALQCWNETDGAKKTYYLDDEQKISLNILYNYFYENESYGGGDENEYSVCTLLSQGNNHYLFTGDLEATGESLLVQYNDLPKCQLFKAGHHGSYTATSNALLSVIQPEIVCVCCCAGSTEYAKDPAHTFPAQEFVDRVAAYTDKVYVTTVISEDKKSGLAMNGNIVVSSNGGAVTVNCSNNNILLKDTEWFAQNRTCPEQWET